MGKRKGDSALPLAGQRKQSGRSKIRKSTRARWRAFVLILVHVAIAAHVAHYLSAGETISPVEPSEAMYTLELGEVNAGFVFFAAALLATLVLGRFVCGWGCHLIAVQDFCGWLMKKLGVRPRPFRSRLLVWAPMFIALYMFVWPQVKRLVVVPLIEQAWPAGIALFGRPAEFLGFTDHMTTTGFWDTFPGPLFAVLTFLTCGFAAVYTLGAKGFCTYGCPYGAFFGVMDRLAPGRILVTDACSHCGHCTATCTSNVRVHEEVRLFGAVVDPGCMKCMDCISVCPNDALYFGFGKPAALRGRPQQPRARLYALGWREELALAAIFLITTPIYRGLYEGPPLLMSVALGGITAFASLKLWQLWRRPSVQLQKMQLKLTGQLQRSGVVFAAVTAVWLLFTAHSGVVEWHRMWGGIHLERTEATREDVLTGAVSQKLYSDRHYEAAKQTQRHYAVADRWGLFDVRQVKLGLAWASILRGEPTAAEGYVRAAITLAPDDPTQHGNLADLLIGQRRFREAAEALEQRLDLLDEPGATDHFQLAGVLAELGRLDDAAVHYRACIEAAEEFAPARYNLGALLSRQGKDVEAIEQLEVAMKLLPGDPSVRIELGLAYANTARYDNAIAVLREAIALAPDSEQSQVHLPQLIQQIESLRN